jgi:hypothetical protein
MDILGFLCVSLGGITVQLYDSLGSRRACECLDACFSSPNGDRVGGGVSYRRAKFCCALFLWTEGPSAKDKVLFAV